MLKKVDASQLKVGMFIHDLDCGWMEHPFVRNRFLLTTEEEIHKIRAARIRGVVIDCSRGLDIDDAPTLAEADAATEAEVTAIATKPVVVARVPLGEELARAANIRKQAAGLVRTVMQDARLGKAVELDKVGPVVQSVTESILRNSGALLGLLRIKNKDDYTFLHSVSVCALLVAFCRELAQMAAIVDVYDAITSDRCYHKGMSAAEALRKIYEWSKFHFNPALAQEFMRCVGIYPVGTMVLLESGRLGVVVEPHESSLLTPKVNVFFNTRKQIYIKPETVDLSKALGFGGGDKIVRHESPEKWNVEPLRFMQLA